MSHDSLQNEAKIDRSLQKLKQRILTELKHSDFFSGSLNLSIQNGVVRTSKVAIEECDHFTARA